MIDAYIRLLHKHYGLIMIRSSTRETSSGTAKPLREPGKIHQSNKNNHFNTQKSSRVSTWPIKSSSTGKHTHNPLTPRNVQDAASLLALTPRNVQDAAYFWGLRKFLPANLASPPSSSSMRNSWLYLASRSERHGAPDLICPTPEIGQGKLRTTMGPNCRQKWATAGFFSGKKKKNSHWWTTGDDSSCLTYLIQPRDRRWMSPPFHRCDARPSHPSRWTAPTGQLKNVIHQDVILLFIVSHSVLSRYVESLFAFTRELYPQGNFLGNVHNQSINQAQSFRLIAWLTISQFGLD